MLRLLRFILCGIGIPALTLAIIIALGTSNISTDIPQLQLTSIDIQHAKDILHANQGTSGQLVSLNLTERDLNIACTYLLNLFTKSQTHIQLTNEHISFKLLLTLPDNLFGSYVPVQFKLQLPPFHAPDITNLKIGKITISDVYAGLFIENVIKYTRLNQYLELISNNIREINLQSHQLHIKYQRPISSEITASDDNNPGQSASPVDNRALELYQAKLNQTLNQHDPAWLLSLSDVLRSLFQLAQQRSTAANAINENRLAVFVANRYVNQSMQTVTEKNLQQAHPRYPVYLYKRADMAQHFMWSATLSAIGGSQLAQMIGVEKELDDAIRGSGFSFIDLAADRAGMTFGKQATASPEQALKIQKYMANVKHYQAFMPPVNDLPESLNSQAFIAEYQSVNSQKYQSMLQEIDRRIAASDIYQ